ncbi:MAG TPA: NAD(P)H-hydrate epimerase [Candidatus Dormibacteraeota bacterium]|nr:NAD(P)H-hydrate epimerase [Candidatus Dormibacteraeota bacterium]
MNDAEVARFGSLTADDVAALDRAAVDSGVSVLQLMEVAGWQVARCAWRMLHHAPGRIAVVAGRGNNGGDGLVAARHLVAWGCSVRAVVVAESRDALRDIVALHLDAAEKSGVHTVFATEAPAVRDALRGSALVIDALLGTGLRGAPREHDAAAIVAMEHTHLLSVDLPSGLDATTGEVHQPAVRAAATCTLTAMKRGLWTATGVAHSGAVTVADIGMPVAAWRHAGLQAPHEVRGGELLDLG